MYHQLFEFLRFSAHIDEEIEETIKSAVYIRSAKEGEVILAAGNHALELYFVEQGILKITKLNNKGNEVTHFFIKENKLCTIMDSFNNGTVAPESIIAATDVQLIVFEKNKLEQVYSLFPNFKYELGEIMRNALLQKILVRNSYLGEDATSRYRLFMEKQGDIATRVSMGDIASYLNITPQSLSRIRRNLY